MSGMLVFPVVGETRISSGFGSRSSPGGVGSTNHRGIDIAVPKGASVVAPTDITISQAANGWNGGYGNLVRGMDSAGNTYEFAHLSSIDVEKGHIVPAGTKIGEVGSTGRSTGPHLHFGVKDKLGKYVDPKTLLATAKKIGEDGLKKGGDALKKAAIAAGLANPVTAPAVAAALVADELMGDGEDCAPLDFICKLKKWLKEGDFFTRLAMVMVGIILLVAAFMLLARGQLGRMISTVKKG